MSNDILIVDDESDIRTVLCGILEDEGYSTREAATSEQAFKEINGRLPSLVIPIQEIVKSPKQLMHELF